MNLYLFIETLHIISATIVFGTGIGIANFMLFGRRSGLAYIPCMPAILLARRLSKGEISQRGASPCVDLIDLDTYLAALKGLNISIFRDAADA